MVELSVMDLNLANEFEAANLSADSKLDYELMIDCLIVVFLVAYSPILGLFEPSTRVRAC